MVTPRGDRSLRWKMPPLFLSDRADQVGRVDTRQSGSADVTQTPSLPLSLPLSLLVLRGRWNAQISRGRRRRSFVAVVPFHWRNVRHHSNRSHFASYGHRRPDDDGEGGRERREEEEEESAADTFFTVLFYAKRDFRTIHSFFWPVSPSASLQHPRSART